MKLRCEYVSQKRDRNLRRDRRCVASGTQLIGVWWTGYVSSMSRVIEGIHSKEWIILQIGRTRSSYIR